jgi:hypothetical protein
LQRDDPITVTAESAAENASPAPLQRSALPEMFTASTALNIVHPEWYPVVNQHCGFALRLSGTATPQLSRSNWCQLLPSGDARISSVRHLSNQWLIRAQLASRVT